MRRIPLLLVVLLFLAACGGPVAQVPDKTVVAQQSEEATPRPTRRPRATPTEEAIEDPTEEATQEPTEQPTPETLNNEQIAELMRPATVRVVAEFGETAISYEGAGAGTGIVYDLANGYIITNAHVVEGASVVKVALADSTKTRAARVVGRSQCDDLAVLKVDNTDGLSEAKLGDSGMLKAGSEVVALGYPLSFDLGNDISINSGNVSQLRAQLDKFEDLIKIDVAINPGNSGGPLVNRRGEVVGINSLGITGAQNQNYAIAMSQARPVIEQLQEGKNRYYIGLNLVPNEYADYFGTDQGMAVIGVASGSPAAQGGVQPADLLLKVEGKTITNEAALCDILRSRADGDQLKVQILRGGTGEILEGELTQGKVGAANGTTTLSVVGYLDGAPAGDDTTTDTGDSGASQGGTDDGSGDPAGQDEALLVNNTFDGDDAGTWPVGDADGLSASVADGIYTVTLSAPQQYVALAPDESADVGDGATGALVKPDGVGFAGVAIRYSEENDQRSMYVCWINAQQKFGCARNIRNNWTVIVEPKQSDAIIANDFNQVVLTAVGNSFALEINDQEVATFTDDALTRGSWGVYAENFDSVFNARYDEIAVYSLDQ